jgi:hypothetical protein
MRILMTLLLLRTITPVFSQAVINNVLVTTPDRKQIWIIDDSNGRLIYQNWQINPVYEGFRPTVTLVADLAPYRKKVEKMMKKTKKSK